MKARAADSAALQEMVDSLNEQKMSREMKVDELKKQLKAVQEEKQFLIVKCDTLETESLSKSRQVA